MKTIFTVLLCTLTLMGRAQEKETLSLNLTKGETYTQTLALANVILQQIMGQQVKIDMNMNIELSYLVKEKNATFYDLELVYKRLETKAVMPGVSQTASSDNEVNSDSRVLNALVNKPIQVKMDMKGKVLEVSGLEAIFASITSGSTTQLTQLKAIFGDEALKQNIQNAMAFLPDHPVAEGDSWVQELTQNLGLTIKTVTTYTYRGSKDGFWNITGNSTLAVPNKDEYFELNGIQMKSDMQGTAVSELKLDKANGWIVAGNTKLKIKGTTHVKAREGMPGDMSMNMDMENATTYTGSVTK
ncbi:MAG: DUF6263 family protein [Odoribacteraceae bacterium]|jgi:hypothetical protein|nr:DUF6263 family protein [Odoribacteraceae bacterium]